MPQKRAWGSCDELRLGSQQVLEDSPCLQGALAHPTILLPA